MGTKSTKIFIPDQGKRQINVSLFNFKVDYRDNLFTLYLPCAKSKPYYTSTTHSYIKLKIKEFIPKIWRKLITICTISEVLGIIPESLEDRLFYLFRDKYYYEHYPSYEEGDIERTSLWLREYLEEYGTLFNFGYCTSKIFREISNKAQLESFPKKFKKKSALFEFRRIENVKNLTDTILINYKQILKKRVEKWKRDRSHPYDALIYAKQQSPFTFREFAKNFPSLKNPQANIDTFCHESKSDKGIFFYFNHKTKRFYFPKFISKFLEM